VVVELSPGDNGTTELKYDADAIVGGMLGGVGQRLLTTVAKRTAGEFFDAVDQVLTGGGEEEAALTPGGELAGAGAGRGAAGAPLPGTGDGGAAARAGGGGAGPRVYRAPARPATRGIPGGEFAAGVVLGAAAALLGALVGGYLARRAARPRHR